VLDSNAVGRRSGTVAGGAVDDVVVVGVAVDELVLVELDVELVVDVELDVELDVPPVVDVELDVLLEVDVELDVLLELVVGAAVDDVAVLLVLVEVLVVVVEVVVVDEVVVGAAVVVGSDVHSHSALHAAAPHAPWPASHSSPLSGSNRPSPQTDSIAVNGVRILSFFERNVAFIVAQPAAILPFNVALPARPLQPLNVALRLVPLFWRRVFTFTAGQPLRISIVSPTRTTSGAAPPGTRTTFPSTKYRPPSHGCGRVRAEAPAATARHTTTRTTARDGRMAASTTIPFAVNSGFSPDVGERTLRVSASCRPRRARRSRPPSAPTSRASS
jgi:hypothetical protein